MRGEGKMNKTSPVSKLQDIAKELAEARDWDQEAVEAKRKQRWGILDPTDENVDSDRVGVKEELSAPKKQWSH
ncbi:hypothetical protein J3R82DRAFT_110 [Butyriboletus roseoflavus]|nr:hypothetical protein J3R82DRAFT_110 [Butyriboletus roseoflavus]